MCTGAKIKSCDTLSLKLVEEAVRRTGLWENQPLAIYSVPPISSIKRLPDKIPTDGFLSDELKLIAAQGSFEPASCVIIPFEDIDSLELKVGDLMGDGVCLRAEQVDIRIVKCWYQAGTAWHSYFADPSRRELVPELLLHDDDLVRVDHETQDNYLRVDYPDGSETIWVSYEREDDPGCFNYGTEPVGDAEQLLPVNLHAGESRQFWVTVDVPADARPGSYEAKITLAAKGKDFGELRLKLRVLPFVLPAPKTYYDIEKDFYVSIYNHCDMFEHMRMNGNELEQASRKLLSEYQNLRDHGCLYPLIPRWDRSDAYQGRNRDIYIRQLEILKKSGLKTKPLFGAINTLDREMIFKDTELAGKDVATSGLDYAMVKGEGGSADAIIARYQKRLDEEFAAIDEVLGHCDAYPVGWDEPSLQTLIGERDAWRYVHEKGGGIMCTSTTRHLKFAGHNSDFSNYGGWVNSDTVRKWHAMGAKVATYASPHSGPENPDFIRRNHGMMLYKGDLDGTCNYQYYEGNPNIWNEFNKHQFRSFCFVYPTKEGVLDTLAWEGFREAIDDIRYATKLRELAYQAIQTGDIENRYAGKTALQWLANVDEHKDDLNTMRLEMINHILKLIAKTGGEA